MKKKYYKPSDKAVEQMINLSEKYNTPRDHYDIVIQQASMGSADVSYAIDYINRKNEYGRQALPINNKVTRGKNMEISEDPMKFKREMTASNPVSGVMNTFRNKFTNALHKKDYSLATILYLTLKTDYKDKVFIKACLEKKDQLKAFYSFMDKLDD